MGRASVFDGHEYSAVFREVVALRSFRDSIVDSVRTGSLTVPELLVRSADEDALADMSVLPWLEAVPGVGKVASRRALEAFGVADAARTRDLTNEQMEQIQAMVIEAAP